VATALIKSGCRYIVCGGVKCEQWHDEADLAWVMLDLESGPDNGMPLVMTTWHPDESEEEVVDFALNSTNFEECEFRCCLVLIAGDDPAVHERICGLVKSALVVSVS
jgi:hypothetical protein